MFTARRAAYFLICSVALISLSQSLAFARPTWGDYSNCNPVNGYCTSAGDKVYEFEDGAHCFVWDSGSGFCAACSYDSYGSDATYGAVTCDAA